jgi:hypothetical protein
MIFAVALVVILGLASNAGEVLLGIHFGKFKSAFDM